MRLGILCLLGTLPFFGLLTSCGKTKQETGLHVAYGPKGLERLSFDGVVLEDLEQYPADAFHIWHMKAVDLHGKPLTDRQYGWGELSNSRKWDLATHTWQYLFTWGSISLTFAQQQDSLDMHVTEKNNAGSGVIFEGATIYPFVLHFPVLPNGFGEAAYQHLAVEQGDTTPVADFGGARVSAIVADSFLPLYHGFQPAGGGNNFFPIISSTVMDSMAPQYPRIDRPVKPGASDTFTVSLRFESTDKGNQ